MAGYAPGIPQQPTFSSVLNLPKVPRRGYDPQIAQQALAAIGNRGREIGMGTTNQISQGLQNRGLGRSAGVFGAAGAGAQAQTDFLSPALLGFHQGEQNFTENARQFDTQTQLALKQLMFQDKWNKQNQPGWLDILGALIGGGATIGAAAL